MSKNTANSTTPNTFQNISASKLILCTVLGVNACLRLEKSNPFRVQSFLLGVAVVRGIIVTVKGQV